MNLFKQAMYRDKIQSREDYKGTDMGRTMCERGITGVKAGSLAHAGKWKNHKYLYIDANGNYVYPSDLVNNAKQKVSSAVANQKQKIKDRQFLRDKEGIGQAPGIKRNDQILSAHGGMLKKEIGNNPVKIRKGATGYTTMELKERTTKNARKFARENRQDPDKRFVNETQRELTKTATDRFINANGKVNRKAVNQAQDAAHQGSQRQVKGASTEELERIKKRTKDRRFTDATQRELTKTETDRFINANGKVNRKAVNQQMDAAHQGSQKHIEGSSTEELERIKKRTKQRREAEASRKAAVNQQQSSAHQGSQSRTEYGSDSYRKKVELAGKVANKGAQTAVAAKEIQQVHRENNKYRSKDELRNDRDNNYISEREREERRKKSEARSKKIANTSNEVGSAVSDPLTYATSKAIDKAVNNHRVKKAGKMTDSEKRKRVAARNARYDYKESSNLKPMNSEERKKKRRVR